jgi:hypothetical protein
MIMHLAMHAKQINIEKWGQQHGTQKKFFPWTTCTKSTAWTQRRSPVEGVHTVRHHGAIHIRRRRRVGGGGRAGREGPKERLVRPRSHRGEVSFGGASPADNTQQQQQRRLRPFSPSAVDEVLDLIAYGSYATCPSTMKPGRSPNCTATPSFG